jgi:hypothetical protein
MGGAAALPDATAYYLRYCENGKRKVENWKIPETTAGLSRCFIPVGDAVFPSDAHLDTYIQSGGREFSFPVQYTQGHWQTAI